MMSWQTATGATESATVTVAVQVWLLPFTSVTVRVTVFGPMSLQSKLIWSRLRLAMPQASLLPLSICAAVMVALPVASNWTVRSWQRATGATESATVTVAVQVWLLPFTSVTVRVTMFEPMLLQSKLVWSRLRLAMPQASLLPLLICAAVIVALPVTSNWTVRSWQTATGATWSATVTVAVQVWLLPFTSVTVRVTVFGPTLVQSKLVWSRLRLAIPQASLLPLLICAAVTVALPVASNWT